MFHEAELRELVEFDGQGHPVVSLYLKVDPRYRTIEEYKLALRGLFDSVEGFDAADRERIEHYLDLEYDRQARSVVCFTCQALGFWRSYTFNVPVDDAIMVDRRPLVRRLVDLVDTYGNLGVVNFDKNGARFFSFHLGSLEETAGVIGEEVKRHKQGGRSAARLQRREDEVAQANLREVVEQTVNLQHQHNWRRLVLAGTDDNLARLTEELPQALRKLVVGSTPLELTAGVQEVRERAEAVALQARAAYIQQLAENLMVAAGKGDGAVIGLSPTVDAIQSGRVYQLLFTETYEVAEASVQRCQACNSLSTQGGDVCPVCGGHLQHLPDAINTLARRTIAQGAQVIVVPPDNQLAQDNYQIGAFLRF